MSLIWTIVLKDEKTQDKTEVTIYGENYHHAKARGESIASNKDMKMLDCYPPNLNFFDNIHLQHEYYLRMEERRLQWGDSRVEPQFSVGDIFAKEDGLIFEVVEILNFIVFVNVRYTGNRVVKFAEKIHSVNYFIKIGKLTKQ